MDRATGFDPNVVRSQRNSHRRTRGIANDTVAIINNVEESAQHPATETYASYSNLLQPPPKQYLNYFSTAALILNKTVGTGIFVVPATILSITDSKGLSLMLWFVGGIITWAGLVVYLEYGIRFPLTGGELHYIDAIWGRRPKLLFTYMYSFMFVLLSGSQANALIFGRVVIQASTPEGTVIDTRLQKLFGILLVGVVCQLQAISRINYIRFADLFAAYKICFLLIVTVIGFCALAGVRTEAAAAQNNLYGTVNLDDSFRGASNQPYAIAIALLDIMRVYSGYENANFVLEEVRRPPGDPNRVFRRAAKFTVLTVCFFYMMINVSLFAVCTKEELINSPDALSLFFAKVFGPSNKTRVASGTLLAMSSAGNVMSVTFAAVRVKQEIARMGLLPFPAFWAKTTRLDTPGPALLLHWIFSSVIIAATPINNANGYLVFSTLFNYARTVVSIVIGIGIFYAYRSDSPFADAGQRWRPAGSRTKFGRWLVLPLAVLSVLANLFVFALCWVPANFQDDIHTNSRIVPTFVGPTVSMCTFAIGGLFWLWDCHIAPSRLIGYKVEALQEVTDDLTVRMTFERTLSGLSLRVFRAWKHLWSRDSDEDSDDEVTEQGDPHVVESQRNKHQ